MTDLQIDILNTLFFVEPFRAIEEEVEGRKAVIRAELCSMIDKGFVQVMTFDEKSQNFLKTRIYDTDHIEESHFLITARGLDLIIND